MGSTQSNTMKQSSGDIPKAPARKKRRTLRLAVGVVVIAALAVTALGMAQRFSGSEVGTTPDLHRVGVENFEITFTAGGELEAENQTEIRSTLENPTDILEVIDEGTHATKGQTLIRLNDEAITTKIEDQMLSVETSRNDLISAQNALAIQINENDAALRQAKLKVELAQIDLDKWMKGDVVKRRLELSTALEKNKRDSKRLSDKLVRSKDLYARSYLSKDELQRDEIDALSAEAALERAQKDSEVYETYDFVRDQKQKTSDLEEAKAAYERVVKLNENKRAGKEADVSNRTRLLTLREERLEKLQEQLKACTLKAPTDGLVVYATSLYNNRMYGGSDNTLQVGYNVRPNEFLVALPDTSSMVASVQVHESIAGRIHPGQRANIRIDAIRNSVFSGVVKSVGVLAESGGWRDPNLREYNVKILLTGSNKEQVLKPSMRAEAEIILGDVEGVIAALVQAIFHEGEVSYVYVSRGGDRFEKIPVRVGRRSNTTAEIVAGLNDGQTVLLREPTPGEVINREFDPAALAAIQPTPEEVAAAKAKKKAEAAARNTAQKKPAFDIASLRNNPNLPKQLKDKLKGMSDAEATKYLKDMSKKRRGGSHNAGQRAGSGGDRRASTSGD